MRILYTDSAFSSEMKGGAKSRSRFLWKTLSSNFDCDLMLLAGKDENISPDSYYKFRNFHSVKYSGKKSFFRPNSIFDFNPDEIEKFMNILRQEKYDIVFFRFTQAALPAFEAQKLNLKPKIIMDADMLLSRYSHLAWKTNRSLKNRYQLFEYLKLVSFEKKLFNKPWTFLFSNPDETRITSEAHKGQACFNTLPNIMEDEDIDRDNKPKIKNFILFFGALDSLVNRDALSFLLNDIYPTLKTVLEKNGSKLLIAGKNPERNLCNVIDSKTFSNVELIPDCKDMKKLISSIRFTLIPVRFSSGTLTRILEAASQKKAVLCTAAAASGFEDIKNCLFIEDNVRDICSKAEELLSGKTDAVKSGEKLYMKCREIYSEEKIKKKLISITESEDIAE